MDKINKIVELLDLYEEYVENSNFKISKIEKEVGKKKRTIQTATYLKNSIVGMEKKVRFEYLYSLIIIGLILYLIF